MHHRSIISALLCLALLFGSFTAASAQTEIFFPETGHSITGRFLRFWQQQGGLAVFGYPITDELTEDGRSVQYFERQRFELHPENQPPYDVLLGRMGAEILAAQGVDWRNQPTAPGPVSGCLYFAETRHNVCDQQPGSGFLSYWRSHGLEFDGRAGKSFAESLALFGYPITEPHQYTNSSGQTVQAQWFERARFEWHSNNPDPFKVLLGRLGAEPGSRGSPQILPPPPPAAIQTVLDYYDAINRRSFAEAFSMWANSGAASNQTLKQFAQGFANTVQVSVLLGNAATLSDNLAAVPLTILAVSDVAGTPDQQIQQFRGTYRVQRFDNTWKLASAAIEPSNDRLPPNDVANPPDLIQAYYDAINGREFARAYTYWGNLGKASNQTFAEFQQGFATTSSVGISLGAPRSEGAAGSIYVTVPIVLVAIENNRTQQTYCGTYTLRRSSVPPFDKFGLRIEGARIVQTNNVLPGTDEAWRLLEGGCLQEQ